MERKKMIMLAMVFLIAGQSRAQVADDFSDGDFLTHPTWSGHQSKFVVAGGQLKLQAPPTMGTAYLSTPSQAVHDASWEFYVQFDFNPSSSNYAKFYLIADQPDLQQPLHGYFVKVGYSTREVSLYKQAGIAETEIIDGLDDRLNFAVVRLRVKVTRSAAGDWVLMSDVGLTGIFTLEGTAKDDSHLVSSYCGIQCIYTSSRADKFWFDAVFISGIPVPDTSPPEVAEVIVDDAKEIRVVFSEPVTAESATSPENYRVADFGIPVSAVLQSDLRSVSLGLIEPLRSGVEYYLQLIDISDVAGNRMLSTMVGFLFFQPVAPNHKDIIFTEVFPDPTPQNGLPSAEFIEIHNRSSVPFDMKGWQISDGSSKGTFVSQIFLPGDYWVITSASVVDLFEHLGITTIGLINFPSLNNGGDAITLRDPTGTTIDSINYNLDWYRDEDKAAGGWSLELIDPKNPCGEQDNWAASENPRGGTPGSVNSILANKPDVTSPRLLSVLPEDPSHLVMVFSEKLKPESLFTAKVVITPPVAIYNSFFSDVSLTRVQVDLAQQLQPRQPYTVEVHDIQDCTGNELTGSLFQFGLPERADSLDVVVNEILFNPRPGGVDFVECHNTSDKFIYLKDWKVINQDGASSSVVFPGTLRMLIHPHTYFVLSQDPEIVKMQYSNSVEENMICMTLPGLPDDEGSVAIVNEIGKQVDKLSYSKVWHSEFLKSDEGVSLERISLGAATQVQSNWTSASSTVRFGTPGLKNSQHRLSSQGSAEVSVVPEVFVAGNGSDGFVQIHYHFDQSGLAANVMVINQHGNIVRTLSNNGILGSQGFLRWDGDHDDGRKAPAGYYVVIVEAFSADGNVSTYRRRVVIACP